MTKDKFEHAQQIQKQITDLLEHREETSNYAYGYNHQQQINKDPELQRIHIGLFSEGYRANVLLDDYLIIDKKDFVALYLQKVDNKIAELEAEFTALQAE